VGWRKRGRRGRLGGRANHLLEAGRSAEHEYSRGVGFHPERVWDTHRDDCGGTRLELEALLASLDRQPSLENDVALVLRVRVKGRRGMPREEKLDQREAPVACLS
jgi:hypothetical protein